MATNKRKCKNCDEVFEKKRPLQYLCSVSCSIAYGKKERLKQANKSWKVEKSEMIEKLKTLSDWKNDLQYWINYIVRLIDKDVPCIATGATTGKRNAGHRFSVGSNDTIRFHLCNIHVQSEHSNKWKGGDNDRYTEGLLKMYGQEYTDYVLSLNQTPKIDLSKEEIKEKIVIAKQIVKQLKDDDFTYCTEQRIDMRKKFNERLGIYK